MRTVVTFLLLLWLLLLSSSLGLAESRRRSTAEKNAFQREHPCPATGERRGRCPGYVIDHVQPLCAGGPDHRSNMQWQTHTEAAEKDKQEWATCRILRHTKPFVGK